MSYNQKPPGPSGSGMGGGPPNGPNNIPQVSKTFAGIQQQMQNLVHGQNAIPQSSQADINAFLQQQRIQNMLKQQQQFLQFQHQMQAQQQQQQQIQQLAQQRHNIPGGGNASAAPVVGGSVSGVGAGGAPSGGVGGSGEPLALTRTPGAAELLNKTYQQQANGNPTTNPTFNQLQETLQALPTNFVQQLQALQYQMQAKQMQQQQHGGGQSHQGGHGQQQQPVQAVPPPPPPTTSAMTHQQQQHQQHQQKHQQHQHQQQQNAAAAAAVQQLQQRYLTAAAAAVSGNKISSATPPPPPPPLTNQMKPPNLPPNTQITPVTGPNVGSNSLSGSSGSAGGGPHQKLSAGNTNTGLAKHQAPPPPTPSISLTPTKQNASTPSVAHQQNKFMPPSNSGGKGGHLGHSQNLSKSTHGGQTTSSNVTGNNADTVVAAAASAGASALKSPQSTPVQLTKQTAAVASAVGSKTGVNTTAATTTATMVSPQKSTTQTTTVTSSVSNTITTLITTSNPTNSTTSQAIQNVSEKTTEDLAASKAPLKPLASEKEPPKLPMKDGTKKPTDISTPVYHSTENNKKDTDNKSKENKLEPPITPKTPFPAPLSLNQPSEKACNDVTIKTAVVATATTDAVQIEPKATLTAAETKLDTGVNLNKPENPTVDPIKAETDKKSIDAKKIQEKNKTSITGEKSTTPLNATSQQETSKKPETVADDKKPTNQAKKSNDEIKTDKKEEIAPEIEKKPKSTKTSKIEEEYIIAKDTSKLEKESEKLKAAVVATPAVAVTSTEKTDVNIKNSLEVSTKNDKDLLETAAVPEKKVEKETSIITNAEKDKSIEILDSLKTDAVKEVAVKEKEEPHKQNKTNEKSESTIPVKSAISTKTINDDTVGETTKDSVQKEISTAAATLPVKKLGRIAKGAKSKTATAPSATVAVAAAVDDSKTPEKQREEKPSATAAAAAAAAASSAARVKRKSKTESSYVFDSAPSTPRDDDLDRKSKRHRLKTILYQSPLPELAYITKLSASEASNSPKPMSNEDRLIVFYKNEYMAVRNSEGTFYLCQTMQNVYRTSPRISIRWLSEDAKDNNVYIPDFYDHTDIECVLTTVELKRIDKGHLRLPKTERIRIENILKKAIDVEKGIVPRPDLTEENPDGLDISLYKDESQIEKKSSADSGGLESGTPSTTAGRKSRKGNAVTASSSRKSMASATPSTSSAGNKRKRGVSSAAASTSNSRKSPAKKRKTLLKRKKKMAADLSDDEDDDETSDDSESDMEYKPTQKRSSLNTSATGSKTTPRAQRSPLAKARAASPITPTTSRSKNVPQKTTPTPSTSKVSRGERAAKRKSITDAGSSEETPTPVKKPMTSSTSTNNGKTTFNNKNKASKTNSTTPVKKSLIDSKATDSTTNTNTTTTTITSPTTTNTSQSATTINSSKSGYKGVEGSAGDGGGGGVDGGVVDSSVNRPARSRK